MGALRWTASRINPLTAGSMAARSNHDAKRGPSCKAWLAPLKDGWWIMVGRELESEIWLVPTVELIVLSQNGRYRLTVCDPSRTYWPLNGDMECKASPTMTIRDARA
jgi:hypothetical protein